MTTRSAGRSLRKAQNLDRRLARCHRQLHILGRDRAVKTLLDETPQFLVDRIGQMFGRAAELGGLGQERIGDGEDGQLGVEIVGDDGRVAKRAARRV